MSTGGIFILITNDGKQDRMLHATDLLRQRLQAVTEARQANPAIQDPTPTLLDIEKTHILFTNAHFKPFAAIGYEYNKTNPQSGNSSLGSQVTFSIPQFGDFFHDMVLYAKLQQPVVTYTAVSPSDQPLMRWAPYPGERLCEIVEFEVNGNPLDKYYSSDYNFHREFSVQPNKRVGWNRCVGQQEVLQGTVDQPTWAKSGIAPSAISTQIVASATNGDQTPSGQKDVAVYKEMLIPLLFWCKDVRLAVPSVAIPYGQRFIKVTLTQGANLVNLVPRGAGDWTDAGIGGSLNYSGMLQEISLYINNIFVMPEVHNIFIKRIGFSLIRVHRQQVYTATAATADVLLQQLKWPIETMFVGMRMADYNSTNTRLQREHLDKWHTFSKIVPTTVSPQGWCSGKTVVFDDAFLPATTGVSTFNTSAAATAALTLVNTGQTATAGVNTFAGIAPGDLVTVVLTTANTSTTVSAPGPVAGTLSLQVAAVEPSDGTLDSKLVFIQTVADACAQLGLATGLANPVIINNGVTFAISRNSSTPQTLTVKEQVATIDSITISAHGIPIYNKFISKFYNAYLPYHFGGSNIAVSEDLGALFIPFNLYPGTYQPSGHINISRAREFYINYTSSVISGSVMGTLLVNAVAINFLLISDGSAVLRYST